MKKYLVKTPNYVKRIFANRSWAFSNTENKVYFTFDDGPIPEVTPWVLDLLKQFEAQATFFCIGDNVRKHPEILNRITSEGHAVGNHTMHHLNGWRTVHTAYLANVELAEAEMAKFMKLKAKNSKSEESTIVNGTLLFRPPYGKLTSKQTKRLQKKGYQIIMWDVLSADFDTSISEEDCLQNVIKHLAPGSIVVFHDSLKAEKNLKYALPKILKHIKEKGWKSAAITTQTLEQDQ